MIKECIEPPLELLPIDRGTGLKSTFWQPGELISISFLDGTNEQKSKVRAQVADNWEPFVNLFLVWDVPASEADVRISFNGRGGWCYMGKDCRLIHPPNPTMMLGFFEERNGYDRIILHEFGHMLGMHHGQENPAANIPWKDGEAPQGYYSPAGKVDPSLLLSTEFDRDSVMVYFVTNQMTEGDFTIPVNYQVSDGDKAWIQKIYGDVGPDPEPDPDIDVDVDVDEDGTTIKIFIPVSYS